MSVKRYLRRWIKPRLSALGVRFQRTFGLMRMQWIGGFRTPNGLAPYHDARQGNRELMERLLGGSPVLFARYGLFELRAVAKELFGGRWGINLVLQPLSTNAGFFPKDPSLVEAFAECYAQATERVDIFGAWLYRHGMWKWEEKVFSKFCPQAFLTDIRVADAFLFDPPWTAALEGRRILVVHPFAKSIAAQYERREKLFADSRVLPRFASLQVVPAVQSIAGNRVPFDNWFQALEYMKQRIASAQFDVALIGAGAYGLPLASFVKSLGKQAVHTGGVTQVLFGIIGRRWETWYPNLVNQWWVRPSEEERPPQAEKVEGGCYW